MKTTESRQKRSPVPSWGLEDMSTYVIKSESVLIIHTEEGNESKIEMLIGSMWTNIKKMAAGKALDVEMSQCVCGINGTIVAFEETGGKSNIYLFAGSVTVKSKKGTDKVNLQPGQTSSVGSNGKVAVKEFDIEKGAKKFGISMDDIRNHYSNAGTTGNVGLVFTEDKLNYKILSGNTVELTSELKGNYSGHVKIPSVVKHSGVTYQVVGIGKRAFADQTKMKSVEIPASVRSIEEDAFYNTGLASVAVPGNNANVQRHAFRNCRVLTTAIISGKNAYCHPEAFADCNYLQDLRIESPTSTPTTNRSTQTTTTTPQGGVKVSSPGKYSFTLPTNNR
ncbi:MAG: leucine-rich repeat protein [Bacteroidaceae bacterium]|nr:leucine-rich repeat protein [Bacteroidaceae bacterium]